MENKTKAGIIIGIILLAIILAHVSPEWFTTMISYFENASKAIQSI